MEILQSQEAKYLSYACGDSYRGTDRNTSFNIRTNCVLILGAIAANW